MEPEARVNATEPGMRLQDRTTLFSYGLEIGSLGAKG